MDRFEVMRSLLADSRYFKLVCGAGNENAEEVRRLAVVYTLAGANGFDVSAKPEVVEACGEGIDLAYGHAEHFSLEIPVRPFITVSVGMPGDHHVRKAFIIDDCVSCDLCIPVCPTDAIPESLEIIAERCIGCGNCEAACPPKVAAIRYRHNAKELGELLPRCIEAGAENIELHAAVPGEDTIIGEWETVNAAQPDNFISMCLDRFHLSNVQLIERIRAAHAVAGERTIIQADGVPMSGGTNDHNTTLQAIAIADVIQKDLKEKDRSFRELPILLSGGTNGKTAAMAQLCNVPYQGVSIGTHARGIVKGWVAEEGFEHDLERIGQALEFASDLVNRSIAS
ncbi:MAG: 4Fe-4S binding protein [Acidimicrobiales bacterium]|jgi:ferredoxin|nr:4Fe-4S binding protein [Acidimicrobiales bacterium]|tara:strand:+ start:997 stop:2016 length:1020 start_codon:yes stop_codon:yes gene_type:complete